MSIEEIVMDAFEVEVWVDWLDQIGAKEFCSVDVEELIQDIEFDKEELGIGTWDLYMLTSDIEFRENRFDIDTLEQDMTADWELYLDYRQDARRGSIVRGCRS